MTYEEILAITDLKLRDEKLKGFYIDEIRVLDWLMFDGSKQKISFADRKEFKENYVFHNYYDASIIYDNGNMEYFIEGDRLTKEKWVNISTVKMRELKIKRTKEKIID